MSFEDNLEKRTKEVESILISYLPEKRGFQKTVIEAVQYSLLAGGKRIRPMLLLETYRFFGGNGKIVEPFMAAIEMIHTYSLVHDELAVMDNDEFRRGKRTTHVEFGHAMGILAGDALLNYAFETMAKAVDIAKQGPKEQYSICLEKILVVQRLIAEKAGIYGMVGGQSVDVEATEKQEPLTQEKLDFIYHLKTGALIEASMMAGAVLAGASEKEVQKIEDIASKIGLAFQIQDDILDVTSTTQILGKPVFSDEKNQKTTYVTWKGLEECRRLVAYNSEEANRGLKALSKENSCYDGFLLELINWLIYREK